MYVFICLYLSVFVFICRYLSLFVFILSRFVKFWLSCLQNLYKSKSPISRSPQPVNDSSSSSSSSSSCCCCGSSASASTFAVVTTIATMITSSSCSSSSFVVFETSLCKGQFVLLTRIIFKKIAEKVGLDRVAGPGFECMFPSCMQIFGASGVRLS